MERLKLNSIQVFPSNDMFIGDKNQTFEGQTSMQ